MVAIAFMKETTDYKNFRGQTYNFDFLDYIPKSLVSSLMSLV